MPKTFGVVGGCRYEAGVVLFSGRQDELVVLVAERLEGGPVSSRVSAFPNVFSMAEDGPKCTEGSTERFTFHYVDAVPSLSGPDLHQLH